MEWLEVAKTLRPGQSVRMQCCSRDKSMIISANAKGWSAYCFRCDSRHWEPRHNLSLAELRAIEQRQGQFMQSVNLPRDATDALPLDARLWLYKASITQDLWSKYRIVYSPSLARVCIPIWHGSKLMGVTARSLKSSHKPKYLTSQLPGCFFKTGQGETLVVVEDILSAIRVGQFAASCALLNTHPSDYFLSYATRAKQVVCWLDGDKAGDAGTRKLQKRLSLMGIEYRIVRTPKDPKCYSNLKIMEFLYA